MATQVSESSTQDELAFSCKNLSVEVETKVGVKTLLDPIDFSVMKGEILSIIGTSGAGKTTLLRALGGLMPTTSDSTALASGVPIDGPPDKVLMVFQDYAASLLPWRTIRRNVALGLETQFSKKELNERVDSALHS